MSAHIAIHGRLGSEPVTRTSSGGKVWATASLAVNAGREEDGPPLWLKIVAFGAIADALTRHAKGDLISTSGRLQVNRWTDREGKNREDLQVVAEQIVSARTVRPNSGKRRDSDPARQAPSYHGIEGFRALSHAKGIYEQGRWSAADLLRAPFGRVADAILGFMLR